MTNANDILMGSGGAPTAKLSEGVTVAGRITAISQPYQEREYVRDNPGGGAPKFFPSGDPIMSFTVDIATEQRDPAIEDDDGTRRVYMDGARIKKAVRSAVQASGATGLNVGGHLSITCTHYDTPGDIRSGKNYAATYTPGAPANNVLMEQQAAAAPQQAPDSGFGVPQQQGPNPATQPDWAPQQPAQQATQPAQQATQAQPASPLPAGVDQSALLAAMQAAGFQLPAQQ